MKRIGMECALLSMFLFLLLCPTVVPAQGAIEPTGRACFYWYPWWCVGIRGCCSTLESGQCCQENIGPSFGCSADVTPPSTKDSSYIFNDNTCTNQYSNGVGYKCQNGLCLASYASGKWEAATYQRENQPSELARGKPCNTTLHPDSIEYTFITDDRRRAHWILPKENVSNTELLNVTRLSDEQQVDWFQSRGATLRVDEHEMDPADQPQDPSKYDHVDNEFCPNIPP